MEAAFSVSRITVGGSLLGENGYAFSTLSPKERDAYDGLLSCIRDRAPIRLADYPDLSAAEISRLLACIDMDHPELFWMEAYQSDRAKRRRMRDLVTDDELLENVYGALENGADLDLDGKTSVLERRMTAGSMLLDADPLISWAIEDELKLGLSWTVRRIELTRARFDEYIEGCRNSLPDNPNEYQVFKRVFEYVAAHTTYRLKATKDLHDVRSAFVDGKAACRGYSKALQYLLLEFGIPCFTVQGRLVGAHGAASAHAWNYVKIDGQWNIADATTADWDLDSKPDVMTHVPAEVRHVFVDYRCMSLTDGRYDPYGIVPYPAPGGTGNYFLREGNTLREKPTASTLRMCIQLIAGKSSYAMLLCSDDFEAAQLAVNVVYNIAIRAFIAAGERDEAVMEDLPHFLEEAKAITDRDIYDAGWGDFFLQTSRLTPGGNVMLVCAKGNRPSRLSDIHR